MLRKASQRARWLTVLALAALASGGCGSDGEPDGGPRTERAVPGARDPADAPRPNVVVVMTDDQDFRSVSVMPRIRRLLAEEGTEFTRNYATFPLCCPSRATFLTGQYAHNHGVTSNKPPEGGYQALTDRRDTLGVWLQNAGYRTGWIGKHLNGYGLGGDYGIPPGWSEWYVPVEFTELRMFGYRLNENGEIVAYGSAPSDYQTDVFATKAAGFIRRNAPRERPFFLVISPLAPHQEADTLTELGARNPRPAPRHLGRFGDRPLPDLRSFDEGDVADKPRSVRRAPRVNRRTRRALTVFYRSRLESLLAVDDAVARIVGALRRSGELDRSVIVFTSDNGILLGEHRLVEEKEVPYEEASRVPLIVRGPGFPPGARTRTLTANVDLAPTILDLAGGRPTRALDGTSLLPIARNRDGGDRAIVLEGRRFAGLRTGRFVYVEYDDGEVELYDMREDPLQLQSVSGDAAYEDVRRSLSKRLAQLRGCAGPACRAGGRATP